MKKPVGPFAYGVRRPFVRVEQRRPLHAAPSANRAILAVMFVLMSVNVTLSDQFYLSTLPTSLQCRQTIPQKFTSQQVTI